jgi:hypothetical protein
MNEEINDRLIAIEKMVNDNNQLLVKMRRAQKNAAYVRMGYWAILIIATIASFYFVQPYISQLGAAYGLGSSTDSNTVNTLLKQYEASKGVQ